MSAVVREASNIMGRKRSPNLQSFSLRKGRVGKESRKLAMYPLPVAPTRNVFVISFASTLLYSSICDRLWEKGPLGSGDKFSVYCPIRKNSFCAFKKLIFLTEVIALKNRNYVQSQVK